MRLSNRARAARSLAARALTPLLLLLLACGCLAGCNRSDEGGATRAPRVDLAFEKYTLANGLDVILRQDDRLPLAAVNLWYHVGPANEEAGRTGFAHLFEHMMFQASGHIPEDQWFAMLEAAGATIVNGSTDFDRTNYLEDVPANQLELALWMESDRMGFLLDRLDAAALSRQQEVVRNERRQGVENQPYGLVEEALWQTLFPAGHPYFANIIGSHADLCAARLEDVRGFFRQYYSPNNASLCIVGDIDIPQTKALVEKYFASIPRGEPVPPITAVTPPITSEQRRTVTDQIELPRLYMAWITDPIYQPGDAEAEVTARILAGGKASRLYQSLVYEQKIAQTVTATQQPLQLGSVFQIVATAKPGHTPDELEQAIDAELERLAESGPTAAEVAAACNVIWSRTIRDLENIGSFGGVADRLNQYNQFQKDPSWINQDLARYERVTPQAVQAIARDKLARDRRVVVHGVPGERVLPPDPPQPPAPAVAAAEAVDREPWRAQRPAPGPLPATVLPAAKQFALPNGLAVYLVEDHALPTVAAQLVVRCGSAADPAGREGLANFTTVMLDEGTTTHDALGLAREVEALGASLGSWTNVDGSGVAGRALKQNAGRLLELMAGVVTAPTFPANEIERIRNDLLTQLLQQKQDPFQTAIRILTPALYGAHHPYGHISVGSEETLKAIARDDLVEFHRAHFDPASAALVLAGDLTESEARKLARGAFAAWQGAAAQVPAPGAASPGDARVLVYDRPGAPQTVMLLAQPCLTRRDPDYDRLSLMNLVLGGLFSSRLNMNLREDKGWTYGAFSFIQDRRGPSPWLAGSNVQADAIGGALSETMKEIRGMLAAPMTAAELAAAKESYLRTLPALFQSTAGTAGTFGQLFLFEQPPDYYQNLASLVSDLTAEDVFAATQRHLDPERLRFALVGDRAQIHRLVEPLDLGRIADVASDGRAIQ